MLKKSILATNFCFAVATLISATGMVNAQQPGVRQKSQTMLVTATVVRSCAISWSRLSEDRKESDLRLCNTQGGQKQAVASALAQSKIEPVVSYNWSVVDQQTRLDF